MITKECLELKEWQDRLFAAIENRGDLLTISEQMEICEKAKEYLAQRRLASVQAEKEYLLTGVRRAVA